MFYLLPFLLLTLLPQVWKYKMSLDTESTYQKAEKRNFIISQIARFVLGWILVGFALEVLLLDKTFSAFLIFGLIFILIAYGVDTFIYADDVDIQKYHFIILITGSVFYIGMVIWVLIPIGNSDNLYNIVDATENNKPTKKVINIENIVTVPYEAAVNKGKKVAGKIPNPTAYDIGDFSIQKIDDKLFWVAPIEYASLFKALNIDSVPGYIKVSAENIQANPEVVTDYEMKYIPSAVFGEDLMRNVRHNYPTHIFAGKTNFEPNDDGHPYYVVSYGDYVRNRNGLEIKGVILIDAETGEMKDYTLDEVPSFVDEAIPSTTAYDYNKYYGKYADGWLNSWTTQKGVHTPTNWENQKEVVGVFTEDKEMYWFTDHTTDNSSGKSMVGYTLTNARTGELTYYTHSNGFLNGKSAIDVVNDTFKAQEWTGSMPVIYNIYGEETWVVPVLDTSNMYRELAIVHAESGKLVHNKNKALAFEEYKQLLSTLGKGEIDPTDVSSSKKVEGIVERVQIIAMDGQVTVQVLLENNSTIFNIDEAVSPYVVFIKEGDNVSFKYLDNNETVVNVTQFNSEITQ